MTGAGRLPDWIETRLTPGRGNVGSGIFRQVHFIDLLDREGGWAAVRRLDGRSATVSQVVSTGHEVALEEDRATTVLYPLSGRLFCATQRRDLVARPGQALILPPGRRRTVAEPGPHGPFQALVLVWPGADAPAAPLVRDLARDADLAAGRQLLGRLALGGPGLPNADMLLGAAQALVAGALSGPAFGDDAPVRAAPPSALRRAEAILAERFAEEVTIAGVAEAAGISLRQLQDLFRRHHGLSPHAYLTRLRLEQAHAHLKGAVPAPSVTEAALLAGFAHLGRFPGTYRARFGRLPSDTRGARS